MRAFVTKYINTFPETHILIALHLGYKIQLMVTEIVQKMAYCVSMTGFIDNYHFYHH